jgi:hypothetical protein
MVQTYGTLPVARLPESSKRLAAMRFAVVACAALACAAVVTFVSSSSERTVLYSGDPNPADLSDDQVQIASLSCGLWNLVAEEKCTYQKKKCRDFD